MDLKMKIQNRNVDVDWENRSAVSAIMNKLSAFKRIRMEKKGTRQYATLGISMARNDRNMIVSPGDIGYDGTNLIFYTTEEDISCTKLGHITGCSESQIKNMLSHSGLTLELYEG